MEQPDIYPALRQFVTEQKLEAYLCGQQETSPGPLLQLF